ncbi:FadR family transcriptional regulator [Nonomuraea sp. NN258]|uniref:FadR/GntR family transcriptional regulator n=1 Tax=Nonomuraea antri TaxID=2730852 RepID=UPI0015687001|nr:FCD domain-containing protein [Nonomuraea antri]NRQ37065.1 FadR family transcriptional regulator [Nonomuraea antri]
MRLQGLHGQVVDRIGRALVAGDLPAGGVLRLEDVQERYGVSRTVAREAVRVLESKRVVTSRPRVGVTVLPMTAWNLYDPQVIRWRLSSPGREAQLRELSELRAAVEPAAASLAATRADPAARRTLVACAQAMADAAAVPADSPDAPDTPGDTAAFVAADTAFHRALLEASGNGMFAQLAEVTEELLEARRDLALLPEQVDLAAVRRHQELAQAVADGRPAEAAQAATALLEIARHEVERLLLSCTLP